MPRLLPPLLLAAGLLAALCPVPKAHAQIIGSAVNNSVVVGTTAVTIIPAMPTGTFVAVRTLLRFQNESTTATLTCRFDGVPAVAGALGTVTYVGLGSGEDEENATGLIWQGPVSCVSSVAGTNVLVWSSPT